ncbi:MAG: winged helix-turn-helix transcriptional regulator [Thermoplasmatota archaeon]
MEEDLRSRILRLVERYPGLHLREIQRRADCSPMLAEYHLNVLEKLGLVTSTSHGRYRDFFPARHEALPLDSTAKKWLGLLRRPPILAIGLLLLERGSMRPIQIARELGLASSTASYQVRVGVEAGLLIQEDIDGRNLLRLADPARVLALLQAYHPTPDAVSDYASLWSRIFARPAPAQPETVPLESTAGVPDEVRDASRAVQTVFAALQAGPMTQKDLCLETGHARRTVYGALQKLDAMGLLTSHVHLLDTRQTRYWLKDEYRAADSQPKP